MSRKACKRRIREPRSPMLVVLQTSPSLEIAERMSLMAFREGRATHDDYCNLADCLDLLMLGGAEKDDSARAVCALSLVAMQNIKQRHADTGRLGCSGDELQALSVMADYSRDYWRRQAGTTFSAAYRALQRARQMQREGAAA